MTGFGVKNGLLTVPPGWEFSVKPDKVKGVKIKPTLLVVHYGVTLSHKELESALLSNDYVSAHLALTARDGRRQITQLVPFDVQAGHAGPTAVYRGRSNVNSFSIGIEINNPGPLFLTNDGLLVDVYKRPWHGEHYVGPHQSGRFQNWKRWARYTDEEIEAVWEISEALRDHYALQDVVGHDEIRQDKADPGPTFPMPWLRSQLFPGTVVA